MSISDRTHKSTPHAEPMSREWNWHPEIPLAEGPWFVWPPKPVKLLGWIWRSYLQFSDRTLIIAYVLLVAFWINPSDVGEARLAPGWVAEVIVRNFLVTILLAAGLHKWLYGIDGQGNIMKYDPRPMVHRKIALFKFDYQLWDNVFYSLAFGVPVVCAWEIGFRLLYANDLLSTISFQDSPVWFVVLFPLLAIWQSAHFYFVHRLLHWPPLYRYVHVIHHRNVNPGPWSGLSMHPVEHVFYFSTVLIFLIVPSHPVHMIFMLNWQLLGVIMTHSGYEALWVKDKSRLALGSFFHQLHHRYYECNYGSVEMPWDKWLGTYHDGTEEGTRAARQRKKAHGL